MRTCGVLLVVVFGLLGVFLWPLLVGMVPGVMLWVAGQSRADRMRLDRMRRRRPRTRRRAYR